MSLRSASSLPTRTLPTRRSRRAQLENQEWERNLEEEWEKNLQDANPEYQHPSRTATWIDNTAHSVPTHHGLTPDLQMDRLRQEAQMLEIAFFYQSLLPIYSV